MAEYMKVVGQMRRELDVEERNLLSAGAGGVCGLPRWRDGRMVHPAGPRAAKRSSAAEFPRSSEAMP